MDPDAEVPNSSVVLSMDPRDLVSPMLSPVFAAEPVDGLPPRLPEGLPVDPALGSDPSVPKDFSTDPEEGSAPKVPPDLLAVLPPGGGWSWDQGLFNSVFLVGVFEENPESYSG